jgi:hypothetical protein
MKVTKVFYKRGVTLNVGDYESVKIELAAEAELEDTESMADVVEALRQQVSEEVRAEAVVVRSRANARKARG